MAETKPVSTTGPIDTAFLNDMIEHHAREHNKLRALHSDSIEHIAIWTALTELRELRKVVGAVEKERDILKRALQEICVDSSLHCETRRVIHDALASISWPPVSMAEFKPLVAEGGEREA